MKKFVYSDGKFIINGVPVEESEFQAMRGWTFPFVSGDCVTLSYTPADGVTHCSDGKAHLAFGWFDIDHAEIIVNAAGDSFEADLRNWREQEENQGINVNVNLGINL